MCHHRLGQCLRPQEEDCATALFSFIHAFLMFQHRVIKKLFCSSHLAVEEPETNFGAVNHPSVIPHIDAALLPAADWVIRKRGSPLNVLNCLQILVGHFL